ncbi:CoA transferase subunit A [Pseudonocardia ailaonensis]|uniref:CoA transferase subunit A n=1 Tax=Pseudonocardia ailaonensis TaxID=367279 RepID=A0ABN2NB92_9PSEU
MATISPLADAVADLVADGAEIALEGRPVAAARALLRRGPGSLTLVTLHAGALADQLIGAGCVRRLVFAGADPGLPRFREALLEGRPVPLEIEEYTAAALVARYTAGAAGLPFGTLRGARGTDLPEHDTVSAVRCPFTGEVVTAVAAVRPDVAILHARRADRSGNVQVTGPPGILREAALAARRTLVTVEEIVEELPAEPGIVLPAFVVDRVALVGPATSQGPPADRAGFGRWLDEVRV